MYTFDLTEQHRLDRVIIYNRGDCCECNTCTHLTTFIKNVPSINSARREPDQLMFKYVLCAFSDWHSQFNEIVRAFVEIIKRIDSLSRSLMDKPTR